MHPVTIKQSGVISVQKSPSQTQYIIVIQKKNWPLIESLLDIKIDEEIILQKIKIQPKNKNI